MKHPTLKLLWLLAAVGLSGGCGQSSTEQPAAAAPPVTVKLVQPHRAEITRSVSLPGVIVPNQQAALYAKVGGYLKSIAVDKGDPVKEGALLAEIEVPELIADQAKYQAEVAVAQIDYQRIQDAQARAPDLVVRQSVDAARAKYDVARANLERAETLLRFCKITAPFTGIVTARSVDPGAFIPAATSGSAATPALLTIADCTTVRVQVAMPEPETPHVRNDLPAQVAVEELPGAPFAASVTRFTHSLDGATRTMLAEIDVPNPKGQLLPGMYATVTLGVETKKDVLLLPVDAVAVEKIGSAVFTVAAGKAVRVPVRTDFNDGVSVEILEGVKPEDAVILLGKRTFTQGQPVSVTP